uniref:Uncharacterized protein n=1 Tax=Rhizophora mucronata TaxID=61149 RepID=A0A2P2PL38_RHIMU
MTGPVLKTLLLTEIVDANTNYNFAHHVAYHQTNVVRTICQLKALKKGSMLWIKVYSKTKRGNKNWLHQFSHHKIDP